MFTHWLMLVAFSDFFLCLRFLRLSASIVTHLNIFFQQGFGCVSFVLPHDCCECLLCSVKDVNGGSGIRFNKWYDVHVLHLSEPWGVVAPCLPFFTWSRQWAFMKVLCDTFLPLWLQRTFIRQYKLSCKMNRIIISNSVWTFKVCLYFECHILCCAADPVYWACFHVVPQTNCVAIQVKWVKLLLWDIQS